MCQEVKTRFQLKPKCLERTYLLLLLQHIGSRCQTVMKTMLSVRERSLVESGLRTNRERVELHYVETIGQRTSQQESASMR